MKKEYYPAMKVEWSKVSYFIQKKIYEILGRKLICVARAEGNDYWSVLIVNGRLSLSELNKLFSFVNALDYLKKRLMLRGKRSA